MGCPPHTHACSDQPNMHVFTLGNKPLPDTAGGGLSPGRTKVLGLEIQHAQPFFLPDIC